MRGIFFPLEDSDRYINCTVRHYYAYPRYSIARPRQLFTYPCIREPSTRVITVMDHNEPVLFKLYYMTVTRGRFRSREDGEVIMFRMAQRSDCLVNAKTGDFELAEIALYK